jgi:hypothetical protein
MMSPAQAGCRLLLLQEGACGPGTAACSNRLLLDFLAVLYEGVEFGFEGGGVGGDVSWFGAHAGAEVESLATTIRVAASGGCGPATASASGGGVSVRWRRPGGDVRWRRPGGGDLVMAHKEEAAAWRWPGGGAQGGGGGLVAPRLGLAEAKKKSGSDYHVRGEE